MRIRVTIVLVTSVLAVVAGAVTYTVVSTQQEHAATVNGVNLSQQTVDGMATTVARVHKYDPNYRSSLATLARSEIDYQAAVQRGLLCSPADAAADLHSRDRTAEAGAPDSLLLAIEFSGEAPPGYHLTPEAERTPDTATVIKKYEQNPDTLAVAARVCTTLRLVATVVAEAPPGRVGNPVATFRAGLYSHSTVVAADGSPIDVRLPTETPTP